MHLPLAVYDVTYTTSGSTPGSCAGVLTQRLIISATTTDFNYTATTFCINDTNPKATITGVLNGKFSSSTGLVIDPSTGTINLLALYSWKLQCKLYSTV